MIAQNKSIISRGFALAALLVISGALPAAGQFFAPRGAPSNGRPQTTNNQPNKTGASKGPTKTVGNQGAPRNSTTAPGNNQPGTNPRGNTNGPNQFTKGAAPPAEPVNSGEALWIWAPVADKGQVPAGTCFFRKAFDISAVELAMVQITCDDKFELYVNGQVVGSGDDWRLAQTFDIAKFLLNGRNVVAVKAENTDNATAGLVARVTIRRKGSTDVSYDTDTTWRVSTKEYTGWQSSQFNDQRWARAQGFGEFGIAEPWEDKVVAADGTQTKRFAVQPDYRIERLVASEPFESLLAMTFNEFGEIVVSKENGPIQLVADKDEDGNPETVMTFCDQVTSCQGLLCLSGDVYAVGQGPEGPGLYRISDADQNGLADDVVRLLEFEPALGEHGPHGIALGPDGLLYVMIGNHAKVKAQPHENSPYRHTYEGDLFSPKYEDPHGHAAGIKAPCGTVVRTDTDGSFVEVFAGGFRNAYDLAFNRYGDLFTYDSDMESDMLLPWYRPTRVLQVVPGGDFGSRSGWSVWPNYYVDVIPPVLETLRGSPTGIEVYDHHMYPPQYQGALFFGDWSQGRILAVKMNPQDGTYSAESEIFLEGRPLNVIDMSVGPDGWLYFCTGGRGTDGGVYRIVWKGEPRKIAAQTGIMKAVRQPQLDSAHGRQQVALVQQELGDAWDTELAKVAESSTRLPQDRVRALDLMLLFGTAIEPTQLDKLAQDKEARVRAKAAYLMGVLPDESLTTRLTALLTDPDPAVRRTACESIARCKYPVPSAELIKALRSPQRFVAQAARRALEGQPTEEWKQAVLKSDQVREFLLGSVAMMSAAPNKEDGCAIVERGIHFLNGYLSDDDFIDLLRVFSLALTRAELKRQDVPTIGPVLAEEFPANESRMNRELARVLGYLEEPAGIDRMVQYLVSDASDTDKLQVALHLRYHGEGWKPKERLHVLRYLDKAQDLPDSGNSVAGYIDNIRRDFCKAMPAAERDAVLQNAIQMPGAALSVLATMEELPDDKLVERLIQLDRAVPETRTAAFKKLQTGIVALLAMSGKPTAMAYLREQYEIAPERRSDLAMGLSQKPEGENWPFLIRALNTLEGGAAQEVLVQLAKVDRQPTTPDALRSAILTGLKLGEGGGQHAVKLLERWTGEQVAPAGTPSPQAIAAWQTWFASAYPDQPPATLPVESQESVWNYQQLLTHLTTDKNGVLPGNPVRGNEVFEKALCAKCHRFRGTGDTVGPELSSAGQRFQRKELLESIMFPSQVISDQYASKTVTTVNGLSYTGMVSGQGANIVVLQSNGQKVTLRQSDIEESIPSKKSAMPEGLLNPLTLEEIADLIAMLTSRSSAPPVATKPATRTMQ